MFLTNGITNPLGVPGGWRSGGSTENTRKETPHRLDVETEAEGRPALSLQSLLCRLFGRIPRGCPTLVLQAGSLELVITRSSTQRNVQSVPRTGVPVELTST